MRKKFILTCAFLGAVSGLSVVLPALADAPAATGTSAKLESVSILPSPITLSNPEASQRLLVQALFADGFQEDWTGRAQFASSAPSIASVDEAGRVRAVSDGEATITATVGGRQAKARVVVRNTRIPFTRDFKNHVVPVMTKAGCNSGPCHGAAAGKSGFKLSLRGYDPDTDYHVLTRQAIGRRVVKTEPARSLILLKPSLTIPHGGGRRFEVGSTSYRIIAEWIGAGTPPPLPESPKIERLEVLPAKASLRPQAKQRIVVLAHFSDGHVEDVSAWGKYDSTELGVAAVDDQGLVKMQGFGEAAITVTYMNLVSVARFTVPFPHRVNEEIFRKSPRNNYIDDLVLEKLQRLRIPPSDLASDSAWIRRVYLDTAGILPGSAVVEAFLADGAPDKREKLVDELLERPEFIDYWAYKWSDVLLLKGAGRNNPGAGDLAPNVLRTYYNWIRSSVESNKPWDRFVREMLISSGSNVDNGAINFLVTNIEPLKASENVSKAFLGLSLNCAKCHNHPLEKWTQDDYYAMANLFARVGRKNGSRLGEVIVYTKAQGEINHPRMGRPLRPKTLTGVPLEFNASLDRREYLAEWLTSAENPLFARTLVNRVWGNFMGRGLVDPVDDMRATNPASNEKLLSALTEDFVRRGFDVKALIRTLLRSATYQLSSSPNELNAHDLKYNSHYLARRLPAEVILDAISQVTAVPEKFSGFPVGMRALQLPDAGVRSYFLSTFGRNPREVTDEAERESSPSITQVLHIANGETLNRKLMAPGGAVDMLIRLGVSDDRLLDHVFLSSLSRYPTDRERRRFLETMDEGVARGVEEGLARPESKRQTLQDLFWAVLSSKEFLFNR